MVSAVALMTTIDTIVDDIYSNEVIAENDRLAEYHSTNLVKAYFRGYITRKRLSFMDKKAICIQRFWRGYLGRRRFRRKLNERVKELAMEYFHQKATKIQSCWRGYFTRKYVANYYLRKWRLRALDETNKEIRKTLGNYAEAVRQETDQKNVEDQRNADLEWARSHHYLVSTVAQFGVYNSPFLPAPQKEEYLLLQTKPRTPPKMDLLKSRREDNIWKSYNEPLSVSFPKLPPVKPQGPFRYPEQVLKQRMKGHNPTLRVETDYYSEETARKELEASEWLDRVHDDRFLYFFKYKKNYEPLIWTRSDFKKLKYGYERFREGTVVNDAMQSRVDNGFRTILPPIPIFDKFGTTYSQGEV